jgi:hypothetical protein
LADPAAATVATTQFVSKANLLLTITAAALLALGIPRAIDSVQFGIADEANPLLRLARKRPRSRPSTAGGMILLPAYARRVSACGHRPPVRDRRRPARHRRAA